MKEICVSVGTRRRGGGQRRRLEEGWGGAPSGPLGFLKVAAGSHFCISRGRCAGPEVGGPPRSCRCALAPGALGSTPRGHTLAHWVPTAALGGWDYSHFQMRNHGLREVKRLVPSYTAGECPGRIQTHSNRDKVYGLTTTLSCH